MGAATRWTLVVGVVLLGRAWSAPLSHPVPVYDARLSSLELAIIKCIVETVPGATKGGGGAYDWSVVRSRSKQLEGAEIEVVQVGQREPDFTGGSRGGAGGYPNDWNIVRSVSSQLAAREGGSTDGAAAGREGLSDDWGIVRSISTELHLDVEVAPDGDSIEPDSQLPLEEAGRGHLQANEVVFPSGEDTTGGLGNMDIDIRSKQIDLPSDAVMENQRAHTRGYHGGDSFDAGSSAHQEQFGNGESTHQTSGEQNNGGGAIGWSIVRSISSEQEPISEEVPSTGNQQSSSSSETQEVKGDTDSYLVVQPIATELQPADHEAGEIPASLTEMFPPAVDQTGGSWNSPPANGAQPSEVDSPGIDQSSPLDAQEPCETGHKRIKNVCRKVYTFQLKSHLR